MSITNTGKVFNIGGLVVEQVNCEPCLRVSQYMKQQPITCACSKCLVDNKGMSNEDIITRMDKAYN